MGMGHDRFGFEPRGRRSRFSWHDLDSTHHILLGAGVIALEGLMLRDVAPGAYQLVCLPLRLSGALHDTG